MSTPAGNSDDSSGVESANHDVAGLLGQEVSHVAGEGLWKGAGRQVGGGEACKMNRFWFGALITILLAIAIAMMVVIFRMVGSGAPIWRGQ